MKKIILMSLLAALSGGAAQAQWSGTNPLYTFFNVGIGTSTPITPLHVQNGCVLFDGVTGSTPVSGAGTRMMWIPDKDAFRAGFVAGAEWDNVNIGKHSGAFGYTTTASGDASFAINSSTEASGDGAFAANGYTHATAQYATALGDGASASGYASLATGQSTASGAYSLAGGVSTDAPGDASVALGFGAIASQFAAFATGSFTQATAPYSASFGTNSIASAENAFATGNNTQASANNAFAAGASTQASGTNSAAFGAGTNAVGDNSFAAGSATSVTADNASAFGESTTASAPSAFATGASTQASGTNSAAFGASTNASGLNATAMGNHSLAAGSNSVAAGNNVQATNDGAAAFGVNSVASGTASFATGEANASGDYSVAMGGLADNNGLPGTFCFADRDPNPVQNGLDNQFMARALNGFVFSDDATMDPLRSLTFDNGNLGVGTGTGGATEKVDVEGRLRVRDIPINNTSTDILVRDINGVVNTRSISGLGIGTDGWEAVTPPGTIPTNITQDIFRNGRVGLGTNNPDGRLHIVNPPCTNAPALHLTPTPSSPTVCGPGSPQGNLLEADDLTGATKVVINPNGSVGLGGTLNPLMLLDLHRGDMIFTGHPTNTYRMHYQYWLANPELFISPTDASGNLIGTGIVMGTTGNVGIGINSSTIPGNRLQVNGHAVPASNCAFTLGTSSLRWNLIFLCNNPVIMSDARLKTNIQNSEYGIEEIKKLRPVTYNLTDNEGDGRKIGLIAQEAKEVISEIVHVGDDADKMMGIKYSELIPVLITAVQQQQTMIDDLKKQVEQLQAGNTNTNNTGNNGNNTSADDAVLLGAKLYQNVPNPFNVNTEIRYFLPEKVKQAALVIYDLNGRQLRSYDIAQRGDGSVVVHGEELAPGMYLYSLIVEGREADTKRMVLSK